MPDRLPRLADMFGPAAGPAPKCRPRVYPKRAAELRWRYRLAMARDAAWQESDHPRAANGQFGAGSAVHIVTTHDPDTGETTFHHVGADARAAAAAHAEVDADDDVDFVPEYHAPKLKAAKGERTDTVRIVHSGDGLAGTSIHGVHASYGAARAQAHDASLAEWQENGPRRSEAGLSDLEKVDVAQAFNDKQEADGDDVRIRVDGDGDPVLDDDGGFVFEQGGEEVDLDEGRQAEFDGLSEDLYPNVPRSIGFALTSGLATLPDLCTVLGLEDVYDVLEVVKVNNRNELARQRHAERNR